MDFKRNSVAQAYSMPKARIPAQLNRWELARRVLPMTPREEVVGELG
jgi:hypothetical protein